MKIGIIGSGAVGQTLAKGFKNEGHAVTLGTRDISKPEVVQFNKDTGIPVADFETTAKTAELIVLSTKGTVAADALRLAGIANLDKKIVIDTTNPLAEKGPDHGVLHFFTTLDFSLMEQLQQLVPAARFVKAFNSVGNTAMYKPQFSEGPPSMFICGNDEEAKKTVTDLLTAFGWETEDMGTVEAARAIEPLCILWCIPGFLHNSWSHAFKLLK
ncbi:NAD(P)-binding domain-containing protein [Chitinophaga sp. G-6-1-13]|uniref:NAD(P)-binding domain-containing protein n=1 Tax=Chitinophaga fulva TaxID=2728842 RepID=A0A848GPY0_9BACT|nr:NAD(P)-binding domain-containing protein [Chitinophaga fulva]NML38700.1 NAD(P)-binding domain-containing protein [Chitinophaga fulva]